MNVEDNQLRLEFTVTQSPVPRAEDLQVQAVFTNVSDQPLRLNGLFLKYATLMLKVRTADKTLIPPGPPPLPPVDDGQTGRIELRPQQSVTYVYKGSDYFGAPVKPGKYQVRFRYQNSAPQQGDWTGKLETDWLDFEVHP